MIPTFKEGGGWKIGCRRIDLARRVVASLRRSRAERAGGSGGGQSGSEGGRGATRWAAILFNRAALFPTISAGVGASSIRESNNRPFFPPGVSVGSSGDFLASLDMSYEIDLWGRVRRTVAAARQEAQAAAADVETAKLSLQAALVVAYFELRSADAQQRLLDATLKAYAASLELTIHRFEEGAAPKSDVALAQTQLRHTRAQTPTSACSGAQLRTRDRDAHGRAAGAFRPPPPQTLRRPPSRRGSVGAAGRRRHRGRGTAVAEPREQIGIARRRTIHSRAGWASKCIAG
jgi:hypothetical protein